MSFSIPEGGPIGINTWLRVNPIQDNVVASSRSAMIQRRLAGIVSLCVIVPCVTAMLLLAVTMHRDRELLNAAKELVTSALMLQVQPPVPSLLEHHSTQGDSAALVISGNRRGPVSANASGIESIAAQTNRLWQQQKNGARLVVAENPVVSQQDSPNPVAGLESLEAQFSQLFTAITTQSLSADVIAQVSEVGADLNQLVILDNLVSKYAIAGLMPEIEDAHEQLALSTASLLDQTGDGGVLRGYQVRQLIRGFSSAVSRLKPAPIADQALKPVALPVSDVFHRQMERYIGMLESAIARYWQVMLGLFMLACVGVLAMSVLCLRLWRLHRNSLSDIAASGVEASELKQSWVEQAAAIAAGDCTYRWRATDDTNREIARALNSTTNTICGLVRTQKAVVTELEQTSSIIREQQASLHDNSLARQNAMGEVVSYFTNADVLLNQVHQWVGQISEVATKTREQAEQLARVPDQNNLTQRATCYQQVVTRLTAAEQMLESAVDRIVGVRQITDQSKLLALNVSLQMVADGSDDESAELAEQAQKQTDRVEAEVTQIERSVRTASDELHAGISQLQDDIDGPDSCEDVQTELHRLTESMAQGVAGLSGIASDIYEVSSQRAAMGDTLRKALQVIVDLDESDQMLIDKCRDSVKRIEVTGDDLRQGVAHYVIPVTNQ